MLSSDSELKKFLTCQHFQSQDLYLNQVEQIQYLKEIDSKLRLLKYIHWVWESWKNQRWNMKDAQNLTFWCLLILVCYQQILLTTNSILDQEICHDQIYSPTGLSPEKDFRDFQSVWICQVYGKALSTINYQITAQTSETCG